MKTFIPKEELGAPGAAGPAARGRERGKCGPFVPAGKRETLLLTLGEQPLLLGNGRGSWTELSP